MSQYLAVSAEKLMLLLLVCNAGLVRLRIERQRPTRTQGNRKTRQNKNSMEQCRSRATHQRDHFVANMHIKDTVSHECNATTPYRGRSQAKSWCWKVKGPKASLGVQLLMQLPTNQDPEHPRRHRDADKKFDRLVIPMQGA